MTRHFEDFFYPNDPVQIAGVLGRIPWKVAAPSFVWPAPLADNCRLLAGVFPEAALLFFESEACLDYGLDDLPDWLARIGLSYHAHLPLDLPWGDGPGAAVAVCLALADKIGFLDPALFVLHPPQDALALARFVDLWSAAGMSPWDLVIENTGDCPLGLHWPVIAERGLGVCLDLGHVLAYGQFSSLSLPGLSERLRLAHLSAPSGTSGIGEAGGARPGGHGHFSLACLDRAGRDLARRLLALVPKRAVLVLEIFEPAGLIESVFILEALCADLPEVAV